MSAIEPQRNAQPNPPPQTPAAADDGLDMEALVRGAEGTSARGDDRSKKERILTLFDGGVKDIAEIVMRTSARPSYVGQVLRANRGVPYFDLYTSSSDGGRSSVVWKALPLGARLPTAAFPSSELTAGGG